MARTDPQLNFRCPQELRDKLEQAAANKKRSLTSEVVARLERSFEVGEVVTDSEKLRQEIKSMSEHINTLIEQVNKYQNTER